MVNLVSLPGESFENRKRVAAYCRVSTELDGQSGSFEMQVLHYRNFIKSNNNWRLVDIYADNGISGLAINNRPEFNRMIKDCHQGKIDVIVTKSISRFSRNTIDCLNTLRELKKINVAVIFEKENINSLSADGELMISIMAALSQQESESISKNIKMGLKHRYQKGIYNYLGNRMLGYDRGKNHEYIINPDEAKIVVRIFNEFLYGRTFGDIAKGLINDIHISKIVSRKWSGSKIKQILCNEKYVGKVVTSKTISVNLLDKKRIRNDGRVKQYIIENHHEPIISEEVFNNVQEELSRRNKKYCDKLKRGRNNIYSQIAKEERNLIINLFSNLFRDGRIEDAKHATNDAEYFERLLEEYMECEK